MKNPDIKYLIDKYNAYELALNNMMDNELVLDKSILSTQQKMRGLKKQLLDRADEVEKMYPNCTILEA